MLTLFARAIFKSEHQPGLCAVYPRIRCIRRLHFMFNVSGRRGVQSEYFWLHPLSNGILSICTKFHILSSMSVGPRNTKCGLLFVLQLSSRVWIWTQQ